MENHAKSEENQCIEGSATPLNGRRGVKVIRSQVVVKMSHQIKNSLSFAELGDVKVSDIADVNIRNN
eukprot:12560596-Ditylum_brightwellii.AAC.1